jgi:hypothetical protein
VAITAADVRTVIVTAMTDTQIGALILDATLMAAPCLDGLETDRADAILKYLVADLIASTVSTRGRGTLASKSLGDASESYANPSSNAQFGRSAYWNRAIMLDPNGCLARKGGKTASFEKV